MTSRINITVGNNIKKERKTQKITQEQLCERAGLSRTGLSQIETGDKSPTIKTLELITNALDIDIKKVFNK